MISFVKRLGGGEFIKNYFISIDGGGSKTEICIFEQQTQQMRILKCGTININQIGETGFANVMFSIFEQLPLNDKCNIYAGIPGYGQSSEIDRYINIIFKKYLNAHKYTIINDVELAHYASLGLEDGILILSGTGSMALAINGKKKITCGGWGYLIGDEGSAFQIGLSAINHLSHVFDGIEKKSILSKMLCKTYKFDFSSKLVNFVYKSNNYRKEIATISQVVDLAAIEGCKVAISILNDASLDLIKMIKVFDVENNKISYAGSVFNSYTFKKLIETNGNFTFTKPKLPPVLGGILKLECDCNNQDVNETIKKLTIKYKN